MHVKHLVQVCQCSAYAGMCRHTDFVTSLDFHPIDDKYFISGSIDGKVRALPTPSVMPSHLQYTCVHAHTAASCSPKHCHAMPKMWLCLPREMYSFILPSACRLALRTHVSAPRPTAQEVAVPAKGEMKGDGPNVRARHWPPDPLRACLCPVAQVRVWSIPEQRVVDWADVHEMVTAAAFAPDGRRACVGTMKGRCRFYVCEPSFRLEYQAQIGEGLFQGSFSLEVSGPFVRFS